MNNWEAETLSLIEHLNQEIKEINTEYEKRINPVQEQKWVMEQALQTYRDMKGANGQEGVHLSEVDIKDKSHKDILKLIATRNDKLLIVKHAIRMMKDAKIFGNPYNADSAVYSVIGRSPEFVKVAKGVYRLNGQDEGEKPVGRKRCRETIGLVKAVEEVKSWNPNMTKKEVLNTLVRRGFDFKGRDPIKAMNMAWVRLGYPDTQSPQMHLDARQLARLGMPKNH